MMLPRFSRPPSDPYEAAAWWSARRRLRLVGPRDEEAFADWLADPINSLAWYETDGPVDAAGEIAAHPGLRAMRESALAMGPAQRAPEWRRAGWGLMAASLALGFFAIGPLDVLGIGDAPPQAANSIERHATRIGERRVIRLADGSSVSLNTSSVLEVAYRQDRRDVHLLAGQALFRVAKDKNRPFVVAAGGQRITAVGTQFDVRVGDQGAVTVLLVEGKVKVVSSQREGLARIIPAIATETLEPGEKLSAPAGGEIRISVADIDRGTSWTRGQIIFRDDRLVDAVEELNRYSPNRLVVTDLRVADLRVSGVFAADKNDNFVAAITEFYPIEAKRTRSGAILLSWRGDAS